MYNEIIKSRAFRRELAMQSHLWFFIIYFGHYLTHPMAWFHKELFALTEDPSWHMAVIMAFRGSGKSTIMNMSFAIWSVLGKPQKKFAIIVTHSRQQAWLQLENIRQELLNNELLQNDFGPFLDSDEERTTRYLSLSQYNAKILSVTAHQSIRGLRNGPYRPDLIICDDLEDSVVAESRSERERIYQWFMREVIASGDTKTRVVVLGNLLHKQSLLMRLMEMLKKKLINGIFRAYPIIDDDDRVLWFEKFTSWEAVEDLQNTIIDKGVWQREYLLALENQSVLHTTPQMVEKYHLGHDANQVIDWSKGIPVPPKTYKPSEYRISAPLMEKRYRLFIIPKKPTQ